MFGMRLSLNMKNVVRKILEASYAPLIGFSSLFALIQPSYADASRVLEHYQTLVQQDLPTNLNMRLPSEDRFKALLDDEEQYFAEVNPVEEADVQGITLELFTCEEVSTDCLLVSISTFRESSSVAQAELQKHQAAAAPITFTPDVQAYLLDGLSTASPSAMSSVIWVQDEQAYIVQFPAEKKSQGLYLARSMALATPFKDTDDLISHTLAEQTASAPEVQNRIIELPADDLVEQWQPLAGHLPPLMEMRLPTQILLLEEDSEKSEYQLEVIATSDSDGLTTSVFTCEATTPDCFLGHFSTISKASASGETAFLQHRERGNSITFGANITAYVLERVEGDAFSPLTSVMWQQDEQYYRVQFPVDARAALLYTAKSMTEGPKIASTNTASGSTVIPDNQASLLTMSTTQPSPLRVLDNASSTTVVAQEPLPEDLDAPESESPELESSSETPEAPSTQVRGVEIVGSTVFTPGDFQPIFEEVGIEPAVSGEENQAVTLPKLNNLANGITQLYVDQGYITSRAVPPESLAEVSEDGIFRIQVIEGSLNAINIEGTRNLQESYILSRLMSGVTTPLRIDRIEEQLRLLQIDPNLASVEATLVPTGTPGLSDLQVNVEEAPPIVAGISADNYSPPRVGSERIGVELGFRNIMGWGDYLSGTYFRSTTGGANVFDFRYTVPLNAMNGTLQFRAAPEENRVTLADFEALGLRGEIQRYGFRYRQPLIRTLNEEFALSVGFDFEKGQTFVFDQEPAPFGIGPDENGISRTSVFTFGQDYVQRDAFGAWALQSQFNFGTGLFDATSNPAPIPDGHFFSWLFQGQRLQRLNDKHLLVLSADLQLTPNTLLPSQQFTIGGGQSVRGFRQNARSGDNGFRLSVEDRITVRRLPSGTPEFQLAPFVDVGYVWNTQGNPNLQPDQTFLAGVGMGAIFEQLFDIEGFSARVDYALPLVYLNDRGTNAQDSGFYFRVNYRTR
jgi:hemolysin activation/secretion protein